VQIKSGTKATDLQFILRDLSDAYGQGIADDEITDQWKNYTIGQIKDDWIKLKSGLNEFGPAKTPTPTDTKSSDVKALISLVNGNKTLINKLQTVNNAVEVTEFLTYILNTINSKVTGVNKANLIKIINNRFK
jgi:hypothetical protein